MEKEEILKFLTDWQNGTKDELELKRVYQAITQKDIEDCPKCKTKAVTEIRKYYHRNFEVASGKEKPDGREYWLKPGNHQFANGEHITHNNDNTTDEQIAWYLEHYPHIKKLLV